MPHNYKFSAIPGFFVDYVKLGKDAPGKKVTTQPLLGILERSYETDSDVAAETQTQWSRFACYVEHLNRHSRNGESYKLLYVIRHGLGVHNVVMEKVGSEAWKVSKGRRKPCPSASLERSAA